MADSTKSSPAFFKVYLPELSSEKMHIPPAYVAQLNSSLPEKVALRNYRGRLWNLEVEQNKNGHYFKNGWKSFVTENSVEAGDILTYTFNGDNIFDFRLFGKSACEKGVQFPVRIAPSIKEEYEEIEVTDDDDSDTIDDNTDDDDIEIIDDADDESSDDDNEDNDIEVVEEEEDDGDGHQTKEKPRAKSFSTEMAGCKTTFYRRGGRKGPVTTMDNDMDIKRCISGKNPYFIVKPGLKQLYLPVSIIRDHNIKLHPNVILRDPDGREWVGRVNNRNRGRYWVGRWTTLCRSNGVVGTDTCVCEFVLASPKSSVVRVLQIHILRGRTRGP